MKIKTIKRGAECEIQLAGRLDAMTAPEADRVILELAEEFGSLIFDLARLEYISSAGLRVFKRVHLKMREKNGSLTLKNAGEQILETFELTGFEACSASCDDGEKRKTVPMGQRTAVAAALRLCHAPRAVRGERRARVLQRLCPSGGGLGLQPRTRHSGNRRLRGALLRLHERKERRAGDDLSVRRPAHGA